MFAQFTTAHNNFSKIISLGGIGPITVRGSKLNACDGSTFITDGTKYLTQIDNVHVTTSTRMTTAFTDGTIRQLFGDQLININSNGSMADLTETVRGPWPFDKFIPALELQNSASLLSYNDTGAISPSILVRKSATQYDRLAQIGIYKYYGLPGATNIVIRARVKTGTVGSVSAVGCFLHTTTDTSLGVITVPSTDTWQWVSWTLPSCKHHKHSIYIYPQ